jgi:peptide deformylase
MPIVVEGAEVLRRPCDPLTVSPDSTSQLADLIDEMWRELRAAPGVGLAAPQIGRNACLAVVEDKAEYQSTLSAELLKAQEREPIDPYVLINPRIVDASSATRCFFEGCLSVPDRVAVVERALEVTVVFMSAEGEELTHRARGWHARILQHEIDHLMGTLFVDKSVPRSTLPMEEYVNRWRAASPTEIAAFLQSLNES